MINFHARCIEALKGCRFQAGSTPKRFVSDMQKYIDRPSDLTVRQIQYLYKLTWEYREQHGNKELAAEAKKLGNIRTAQDKRTGKHYHFCTKCMAKWECGSTREACSMTDGIVGVGVLP